MSRPHCSTYALMWAIRGAGNGTIKECRATCLAVAVRTLAPFAVDGAALDSEGYARVSDTKSICVGVVNGSDLYPTHEEFHMDHLPPDYSKLL